MVFSHIVFLFYFFIFQNHICQFYFFYIELIENLVLQFLFFKTLLIATVFLRMVFFLWFSLKLSSFFFNIELIKNYSCNMWKKYCNFPHKLLWIATVFFPTWFFLFFYVFPSNCLFQFYFLNIELVKNCNYK